MGTLPELLSLQRLAGNRAVAQMIRVQRLKRKRSHVSVEEEGDSEADDEFMEASSDEDVRSPTKQQKVLDEVSTGRPKAGDLTTTPSPLSKKRTRGDDTEAQEGAREDEGQSEKKKARVDPTGHLLVDSVFANQVADELVKIPEWVAFGKGRGQRLLHRGSGLSQSGYNDLKKGKERYVTSGSNQKRPRRRPYGPHEGDKQVFRWMSTVIWHHLVGKGSNKNKAAEKIAEVQAGIDRHASDPAIYVATNDSATNRILLQETNSMTAREYLNSIGNAEARPFLGQKKVKTERHARHPEKLKNLLSGKKPYRTSEALRKALDNQIRVAVLPEEKSFPVGYHAERRIAMSIAAAKPSGGGDFRLGYNDVGGIKRPCLVCFLALGHGSGHHGPLWLTEAATSGLKEILGKGDPAEAARYLSSQVTATSVGEETGAWEDTSSEEEEEK